MTPLTPGTTVRRRSLPDEVGELLETYVDDQTGGAWAKVRFGTRRKTVSLDDLEALPDEIDPWEDLGNGRLSGPEALRCRLTFERLRRPPGRIAHSFGSARATLLPYQFKPLLKLLDNELGRLLIADEVGLGKTIEAGYILKELRSRAPLERVLVLAPARLLTKWKRELEKRFDEIFEIVRRRDLLALAQRVRRGSELEGFRWITSYESARVPEFYEALEDVQLIDLLIADEAHRMRNLETNQFRLGRALTQASDAVVFLTATPIQIQRRDLWALLHLLDPERYQDQAVFEDEIERTRPLQRAIAALRKSPPELDSARVQLEAFQGALGGPRGARAALLSEPLRRLNDLTVADRAGIVALQQDLAEFSPTAALISRTRKREVIPNRPLRVPMDVSIELMPLETSFIESIVRAVVGHLKGSASWGTQMKALSVYRYAASSIPAALDHYREAIFGGLAPSPDEDDVELDELAEDADIAVFRGGGFWQPVRRWLDENGRERRAEQGLATLRDRLEAEDSKFGVLRGALEKMWTDDLDEGRPPRKVIVFSYFRKTVAYLTRRLGQFGVRSLHGGLPVRDRDDVVEEFSSDPGVRVLVSSEVGGEGLDLQFASTVVNYDLPWNPMVVDQRIGRVDRLGQTSPRLVILNLVARGTVEERIIHRLYDRVGLFEEVIGELEPIFARDLAELVSQGLCQKLSPEEEAERIEQAAGAFQERVRTAGQLGDHLDRLMAADQVFLDEIDALLGGRRTPDGGELREFCASILRPSYAGTVLPPETGDSVAPIQLPSALATILQQRLPADSRARSFAERVRQGPVPATFSSEAAMSHPKAELLSVGHPLVRFAALSAENAAQHQHAFWGELDGLPWDEPVIFGLWRYGFAGARSWSDLVGLVWLPSTGEVIQPEQSLLSLLLNPALDPGRPRREVLALALPAQVALEAGARRLCAALQGRARERALLRQERRRDSLRTTWQAREAAAQQRLGRLQEREAGAFAIRMAEARLARVERDQAAALDCLDDAVELVVDSELLLVGGLAQTGWERGGV